MKLEMETILEKQKQNRSELDINGTEMRHGNSIENIFGMRKELK